jgi:hypothetical protein
MSISNQVEQEHQPSETVTNMEAFQALFNALEASQQALTEFSEVVGELYQTLDEFLEGTQERLEPLLALARQESSRR